MDDQTWRSRRTFRAGAATAALAATLLVGGVAAAQDPSTSPAVPTIPGDSGTDQQTTPGSDGSGRSGGAERGGRGGGMSGGSHQQGGRPGQQGSQPGSGGPGMSGMRGGSGGPGMGVGRGSVTVTANDGTSLTLETSDGWTRTIDTTGVVLTEDDATITAADIVVGDEVRIAQTRNADGSYTVTGIALQPDRVSGTVASVGTDSFTMTDADGATVTVSVSATTTWSIRGDSDPGLADLAVGTSVSVTGQTQADGSVVATKVSVR